MRWEPNERGIDYLVGRGRLDRITPRSETAEHLIREARRHLASAAWLAGTDDASMAFVAAYDAARKALWAILNVQGIRAKGGDGGHAVLLDALGPQFPDHRKELRRFGWMRTVRNHIEYPDINTPSATRQDVAEAQLAAEEIVVLAEEFVRTHSVGV
ncbi:MAG: HEPN domain-containing protein [Propionibacteriaceae bacterium]|nr:HEPN domain-containing protein [Propionibacteriaceae bacterium]